MMDPKMVAALDQLQATVRTNAKILRTMFNEFKDAGFTDMQALVFTNTMLENALAERMMMDDDDDV